MVPLDRFTVVLDACTLFPMLVRDVLLTLAGGAFAIWLWRKPGAFAWLGNDSALAPV